eukprot:GILK01003949.1.p1 GENE.GILK01003949.1~~GILK01003949.1.p1  ORF type:complete len:377 (-),score=40.39 GILK01003949.1:117-1247(-)
MSETSTELVHLHLNDTKKAAECCEVRPLRMLPEAPGREGCLCTKPARPLAVFPFSKDASAERYVAVKSVYIVVNPFSGNGRGNRVLKQIEASLTSHSVAFTTLKSGHAGHIEDLVRELNFAGHDAILVVGGDGTFHEALNGLMTRPAGDQLPLCLFAGGTGNSFMTDLGGQHVGDVLQWLYEGRTRRVDCGRVLWGPEQRVAYTLNMVSWGIGVDSNVMAEKLRCLGTARYDVAILWEILKSHRRDISLTLDGFPICEQESMKLVQIQNTQHGGAGLRLLPFARLDDGLFDVFFGDVGRLSALKLFGEVKRGGSHVYLPTCHYYQFKTLSLEPKLESLLNVDGENGRATPVHLEVLHEAFTIFTPPTPLPSTTIVP